MPNCKTSMFTAKSAACVAKPVSYNAASLHPGLRSARVSLSCNSIENNPSITMPNEVAFADNSKLARNKQSPLRITKRIREAVDTMVTRGVSYDQAAAEHGIATRHMRLALAKPHVMAYHQQQLKVLRGARSARNFHRLCQIADAENNMPAVNAIKALELIGDEQTNNKQTTSPGVTIRIVNVSGTQ